jgi:RNA polymerase sigma factor (sigma-70 family)
MLDGRGHSENGVARVFATTHWSVVTAAGGAPSAPAQAALETLCASYWYPIYVYVRRKGYGPDEAQDLTQEFFAQLIAKEHLRLADRRKGRFRSFLLSTLDFFLQREWSRAHRQKRGGRFIFVPFDTESPEERYQHETADHDTPEKKFVRQWALAVLSHAMETLRDECEENGKAALFTQAQRLLSGERAEISYAEIGRRLGMSEGNARVAVHRLRQRYGELLREEVRHTVSTPQEVDDELRYLLDALCH